MKRVVTGVNEHGRSYAVSVEELDTSIFDTVWSYKPGQISEWISAIDPGVAADWLGPQVAGGVRWLIDKDGYHTTRTIDFDCLLEGELTLILDEGQVRLERGDCVVQQATRHAWKNQGDKSALLLAVLYQPEGT
jgi:hypothetical protein